MDVNHPRTFAFGVVTLGFRSVRILFLVLEHPGVVGAGDGVLGDIPEVAIVDQSLEGGGIPPLSP